MVRLTEILCPVDLSKSAGHALEHAVALARSYKARLTVLEVVWAGLPPITDRAGVSTAAPSLLLPGQREELQEELRVFAARGAAAGVTMNLQIREGPVVPLILEEARTSGADLIVLGTHGRSGFDRLLLGSVTESVLRKATCAVMTVPPADRTATPSRGAHTIVCAIDFSPASLNALGYALSLGQEMQATLLLIHVLDWPADLPVPRGLELESAAYRGKVMDDTREGLQALVPDEARVWCRTEELVAAGRPHEEIARLARDRDADLIVLGVHGRSALSLALFGSTANQVVRHATCPVVTVRG